MAQVALSSSLAPGGRAARARRRSQTSSSFPGPACSSFSGTAAAAPLSSDSPDAADLPLASPPPGASLASSLQTAASLGVAFELVMTAVSQPERSVLVQLIMKLQAQAALISASCLPASPAGAHGGDLVPLLLQAAACAGIAMALYSALPVTPRLKTACELPHKQRLLTAARLRKEDAAASDWAALASCFARSEWTSLVNQPQALRRRVRHAAVDVAVGRLTLATVVTGLDLASTTETAVSHAHGVLDAAHSFVHVLG